MKEKVSSVFKSKTNFNDLISEQVTAPLPRCDEAFFIENPQDFSDAQAAEADTPPLIDKHALLSQELVDASYRTSNRVTRPRRSRTKKGGWPVTRYIPHDEVITILDGIHQLARIGKRLTHFVTLRPPITIKSDQHQKRWCRRKMQDIQRKLNRRNEQFVGCYVYEKKEGGPIHIHLLVHVPKSVLQWFDTSHNPPEIDVRLARPDHSRYILKNRRWQGPEREKWLRKKFGLRWQKGAPFRGKRWDWTSDAKALLREADYPSA